MTKQTRTLVLSVLAMLAVFMAAACNQNPVSNTGSENRNHSLSGQPTVKDQGKRVLSMEAMLLPGEEWTISVSDFDQMGLDAFISVSVDAQDLRVPAYQTSEECGNIGIMLDEKYESLSQKCRADNFEATSIKLVNKSERTLWVTSVLIGINKSKVKSTKY